MKRRPQGWPERFERSLEAHPSSALEDWRWAKAGEGAVDPRAVDAAWDLVTLQASAEAAKLHHAMEDLDGPLAKTMLPALVVAAARWTDVGALEVVASDGKSWFPRDLSFVPGREHLAPDMVLACGCEVGRSVIDFVVTYRHRVYVQAAEDEKELHAIAREGRLAIVLEQEPSAGDRGKDVDRAKDVELQQEGYLVIRVSRSEIWQDAIGTANEALRTLVESTRFDAERNAIEHRG